MLAFLLAPISFHQEKLLCFFLLHFVWHRFRMNDNVAWICMLVFVSVEYLFSVALFHSHPFSPNALYLTFIRPCPLLCSPFNPVTCIVRSAQDILLYPTQFLILHTQPAHILRNKLVSRVRALQPTPPLCLLLSRPHFMIAERCKFISNSFAEYFVIWGYTERNNIPAICLSKNANTYPPGISNSAS